MSYRVNAHSNNFLFLEYILTSAHVHPVKLRCLLKIVNVFYYLGFRVYWLAVVIHVLGKIFNNNMMYNDLHVSQ